MIVSGARKRVRPGGKSVALSIAVCGGALYLASLFPFQEYYEPLSIGLLLPLCVSLFRLRRLRQGLPEPHGRGRASTISATSAARSGLLLMFASAVLLIGLMGSVYLLPPEIYFAIWFGLIIGLPLANVMFFALVIWLERAGGGPIYAVTEETEEEEGAVLHKTLEFAPRSSPAPPRKTPGSLDR